MSKRSSHLRLPSWMREAIAPFRSNATLAVVLGIIASCCAVLLMFMAGYLISRTAWPGTTLFMVMIPVAFVQLLGIGRPIARYFERLVSHDWVFRVTSLLRLNLFRIGSASASGFASRRTTGSYLGIMVDGIGHLQNLYLRIAFPAITALALFLGTCVFCGAFDVKLALAALLFGFLSAVIVPALAFLATRKPQIDGKSLSSREYELLTDDVIGSIDWALANRSDEIQLRHLSACVAVSRKKTSVRRITRIAELASALLLALGVVFASITAADAFYGSSDRIAFIAAFVLAAFPLMESYLLLPSALAESTSHLIAVNDLNAISAEEKASEVAGNDEKPIADLPPYEGGIFIDDASYTYPGNVRPSVDGVTLHIPSGQHVAIIGRSGSGKSTLASLMRGVITPDAGSVSIGGMPPNAKLASYIPQTTHLFDQTLRDNLKLSNPEATDNELVKALNSVGLAERFNTLPQGLSTPIGETGERFSGGEAHRIALARALLANRPVILLDEPFTALDPSTERALLDTLLNVFADKTLIVITHHLAGVERFDRVVNLEDGHVTLDGAPSDLLENAPSFKRLLDFDRTCSL